MPFFFLLQVRFERPFRKIITSLVVVVVPVAELIVSRQRRCAQRAECVGTNLFAELQMTKSHSCMAPRSTAGSNLNRGGASPEGDRQHVLVWQVVQLKTNR